MLVKISVLGVSAGLFYLMLHVNYVTPELYTARCRINALRISAIPPLFPRVLSSPSFLYFLLMSLSVFVLHSPLHPFLFFLTLFFSFLPPPSSAVSPPPSCFRVSLPPLFLILCILLRRLSAMFSRYFLKHSDDIFTLCSLEMNKICRSY